MKRLILIAGLLLTGSAMADESAKSPIRELDKSSTKAAATAPAPEASARELDKSSTKSAAAQDYNSSRSNTTTAVDAVDTDDDDDGIDTEECVNAVDNDCTGKEDEAPANHNTTRSR